MDKAEKKQGHRQNAKANHLEIILRQLAQIDKAKDQEELNDIIQRILQLLGEYTDAERVYLFERTDMFKKAYCNTFEWCAKGVLPQIQNLQEIYFSQMPNWITIFQKQESIIIDDIESIRASMPSEYQLLKEQNIHTEIAAPIFFKEELTGFIGLDNPKVEDSRLVIQVIALVGGYLGNIREHDRMVMLLEQKQGILEKSLKEQEREKQILRVLCADYISVFRVDLQRDTVETLKLDAVSNASRIMQNSERECYSQRMQDYYENFVIKESAPDFLEKMNAQYIYKELQKKERMMYRYQCKLNALGEQFFEIQLAKIQGMAEEEFEIIMGFRQIDAIVREERQHQKKLEAALAEADLNNEIISAISKIYFVIYRIDLEQDIYEEISSEGEMHRLTGRFGRASMKMLELCDYFVAPEYHDQVLHFFDLSTLKARLHNEETVAIEYYAKDGNWHLARFIVKNRNAQGEAVNVLYVIRLISDEKRREQYWIVAAEEANKANAAKSEFLSRMSHDIRTPMNAIMGLVSIAKWNLGNSYKIQDCLNKIDIAGQNLQQLVDDILDLSQIESGEFKLRPHEMQIKDLLGYINQTLHNAATSKGLEFVCEQHDICYDRIIADQLRLGQICTNLISNAIKYTPAGGRVYFDVREKESEDKDKIQLLLIVRDTGIGMDAQFMEEMYSKFSRAVDTRVNKVRGSGLGLAIVRQIVDCMEGTIEVESTVGKGTTFCVTLELPYRSTPDYKEKEDLDAQREVDDLCAGMTLLMAEDNDLNYEIEADILGISGFFCVRAENGAVCVEKFKQSHPGTFDVILMDMQMPVMSGVDAAKAIRQAEHPQAQSIPIIAITANAFKEDINKCLAAGMDAHLSKPLNMKVLVKTIKQVIESRNAAQESEENV